MLEHQTLPRKDKSVCVQLFVEFRLMNECEYLKDHNDARTRFIVETSLLDEKPGKVKITVCLFVVVSLLGFCCLFRKLNLCVKRHEKTCLKYVRWQY